MKKAVLLDGCRTPIGRFMGALSAKTAVDLGATVVTKLLERVPELKVDEVILAQVIQAGQGQNPARQVAVKSGLVLTIPAITLNSVCLAGLATVADAVRRIERGEGETYIVGGFESMTNAPHTSVIRHQQKMGNVSFYDTLNDGLWCSLSDQSMLGIAEKSNAELNITREEQDRYAETSQTRATNGQEKGLFEDEIVAVENLLQKDEGVRPGTTFEKLAKLRPIEVRGTITAGNASQMSDGASAGIVTTLEISEKIGVKPLATIIDWATVSGPDTSLHLQPANAIQALLNRTGLKLSDIDLFEINEAFAGVVIASQRKLGMPMDVVNVNGGAISVGHPLAGSGFRLLLTLAYELKRRGGGRGIATLCGGGGQGMAILIEV
ncbi:acetyl-CoA C-acyltransferase [Bacillus sp. HNG]|uniref:acetyl-CoA C-acyltransferase n=1 Tax=Bacillus sp. HNG TaxID=2293325 RepID=UPI000E2F6395|nr:acetyl-CoA C-acyltransferase [Bacillus sp. HNG]RFB12687.1 acetyl-CoA C-acyltransferase [Bacillus sp. HNG]